MATKYIEKYTGSSDVNTPADRSKAAGIGYDTNDGKVKYSDAGVVTKVIAENKPRVETPVAVTASTVTLDPKVHAGLTTVLQLAAGVTVTLPAAVGSGAKYRIVNGLALSAASHIVQAASAADYFVGAEYAATDNGSGAGFTWPTANTGTVSTESDTLTWNGGTKGGRVGDEAIFEDIAANVWHVRAFADETGTEATPFSAAV